jgi:hypothetical protein
MFALPHPPSVNGGDATSILETHDVNLVAEMLHSGELDVRRHFCWSVDASNHKSVKCSLLFWACTNAWAEGIALFILNGAHPDRGALGLLTPRQVLLEMQPPPHGIVPRQQIHYLQALVGLHAANTSLEEGRLPVRADVAMSAFDGTPLMFAAAHGLLYGARLLVEWYGANPRFVLPDTAASGPKRRRPRSATQYAQEALEKAIKNSTFASSPHHSEALIQRLRQTLNYLMSLQ